MSWFNLVNSIDGSSEGVDLLMRITDKDLGTILMHKNVQYSWRVRDSIEASQKHSTDQERDLATHRSGYTDT